MFELPEKVIIVGSEIFCVFDDKGKIEGRMGGQPYIRDAAGIDFSVQFYVRRRRPFDLYEFFESIVVHVGSKINKKDLNMGREGDAGVMPALSYGLDGFPIVVDFRKIQLVDGIP